MVLPYVDSAILVGRFFEEQRYAGDDAELVPSVQSARREVPGHTTLHLVDDLLNAEFDGHRVHGAVQKSP
jgi:hypothetical protein